MNRKYLAIAVLLLALVAGAVFVLRPQDNIWRTGNCPQPEYAVGQRVYTCLDANDQLVLLVENGRTFLSPYHNLFDPKPMDLQLSCPVISGNFITTVGDMVLYCDGGTYYMPQSQQIYGNNFMPKEVSTELQFCSAQMQALAIGDQEHVYFYFKADGDWYAYTEGGSIFNFGIPATQETSKLSGPEDTRHSAFVLRIESGRILYTRPGFDERELFQRCG